jgi:hypothetical protein
MDGNSQVLMAQWRSAMAMACSHLSLAVVNIKTVDKLDSMDDLEAIYLPFWVVLESTLGPTSKTSLNWWILTI